MTGRIQRVGLVWAQFSAYHVDRLEAVGRRLEGKAHVLAVEVAPRSETYEWEPSGEVCGTEKRRLFPGHSFEAIAWPRRLWALFKALRRCDTVFVGVPYSELDIIALSFLLRLAGVRVVLMTASKFDDHPRRALKEWLKHLVLSPYSAALVGGCRQHDYVRFLGFRRRRVLPGYNTVSMARVRRQASEAGGDSSVQFVQRRFIYVGRFVEKKNLENLLAAYALYAGDAGRDARGLTLAGDGPLRDSLQRKCSELGIAGQVEFTGFLGAHKVSARLSASLALLLVSSEEQWGLVINEAIAVGLPVIASLQTGAREALVGNLANGFVVRPDSLLCMAAALGRIAANEQAWQSMSAESSRRGWLADTERFADAVELMIWPAAEPARSNHEAFAARTLGESALHLPTGA